MPIRAVVFDLFDTLIDLHFEALERVEIGGRSVPASTKALQAAVARRAPVDLDTFAEVLASVDRDARESHYARGRELPTDERFSIVLARLGVEGADLPRTLTEIHMGALASVARVPDHHAVLLQQLCGRVRLGLCSNFSHAKTALALLDRWKLRPHLDAVAISETVGLRKPRPEIFAAVLAGLDASPADALHVGDSLTADVAGAAAFGIRTVWLTRRVPDPERRLRDYDGPSPDFRIGDLGELPGVLDAAG